MPGTAILNPHSHLMFVTRRSSTDPFSEFSFVRFLPGQASMRMGGADQGETLCDSSDQKAHSTSTHQARNNVSGHISFIYLARACSAKYKNTTQEAINPRGAENNHRPDTPIHALSKPAFP